MAQPAAHDDVPGDDPAARLAARLPAVGEETSVGLSHADLDSVLRYLRGLAEPCVPPIGVGAFDILIVSAHELVVWYSPAREEHRAGEVAIPMSWLAAAWEALLAEESLAAAALEQIAAGAAGGRWLLAVLAQVPGVRVEEEPLALVWSAADRSPSPDEAPSGT